MNYTKGKWERKGNRIEAHGRGVIAICPSPTNDYGVLEFIANAHLIAAAPETHENLKEIIDGFEGLGTSAFFSMMYKNLPKYKQILAKIEGGS